MKVPTKETNIWLKAKQQKKSTLYLLWKSVMRNVFLAIFFYKKKKRY